MRQLRVTPTGSSTSVRLGLFLVVLALAAGGGWGAARVLNPSGVVMPYVAPHPHAAAG